MVFGSMGHLILETVGPVMIIKSVDHVILEEDASHRILEVVGHVIHEDVCHVNQVIFEVVCYVIL